MEELLLRLDRLARELADVRQALSALHQRPPSAAVPIPLTEQGEDWAPLQLSGKLTDSGTSWRYSFRKHAKSWPYTPKNKETQRQKALDHQRARSLLNPRTNVYRVEGQVVLVRATSSVAKKKLGQASDATFRADLGDLELLQAHYWYYRRNRVMARVGEKRVLLSALLLERDGPVHYLDGSSLNACRANLAAEKPSRPETPIERPFPLPLNFPLDELTKENWQRVLDACQASESYANAMSKYLAAKTVGQPVAVEYADASLQTDFQRIAQSEDEAFESRALGGRLFYHFMWDAIWACRKSGFQTLAEVIASPVLLARVYRTMFALRCKFTPMGVLRAYGLKFYKVSNFPAIAARNLLDHCLLPDAKDKYVLDPCAGFGGRCVGFYASKTASRYVSIDPNPRLVEPHARLHAWLKDRFPNDDKSMEHIQACAEEVDYDALVSRQGGRLFDVCMTSPPYFDLELYGEEETQSCIRYGELESWRDNFLFQMLRKTTAVLRKGGMLAVNIKQSKKWSVPICVQMVDFARASSASDRAKRWSCRSARGREPSKRRAPSRSTCLSSERGRPAKRRSKLFIALPRSAVRVITLDVSCGARGGGPCRSCPT